MRQLHHTKQHATHCNILQHTATHCNTLQHTATHCNTLQHTATHCNTLQHTATRHPLRSNPFSWLFCKRACQKECFPYTRAAFFRQRSSFAKEPGTQYSMNVLQCVAVCCSVLQCVAVCCSVLQSSFAKEPGTQYCPCTSPFSFNQAALLQKSCKEKKQLLGKQLFCERAVFL